MYEESLLTLMTKVVRIVDVGVNLGLMRRPKNQRMKLKVKSLRESRLDAETEESANKTEGEESADLPFRALTASAPRS